ncbi:MAG: CdvA-like protein [Candidatus Bathyarchaeota archaeon]|nr:MAG: CdvA-like protein [Candidatus Bathyarchaeota archaeon]
MGFSTDPFLFVGKLVRDAYGRQIGRVASFMVNLDGRIDGVLVVRGDGEFFRYPNNLFVADDDDVTLLSPTEQRAKTLCDEMPLVWRKDQALNKLVENEKIPPEMFDDLHENFENALNQLKADAQTTLEKLDKEVVRCSQQVIELRLAMLHLEVEHEMGEIDEKSYQTIEMLQVSLSRVEAEKGNLEAIRNKLSNILSEKTKQTEMEKKPPQTALMLPEPPVTVNVRNLGKRVLGV